MFSKYIKQDSPLLHACSAFAAGIELTLFKFFFVVKNFYLKFLLIKGFSAVTVTNPEWFVKNRMQLDESRRGIGVVEVAKKILMGKGLLGFYKGISASYFGIQPGA